MEELFVQESAIATEKAKNQNSAQEMQKTGEGKNIEKLRTRDAKRLSILTRKLLRRAFSISKVMNLQHGYGQTNML